MRTCSLTDRERGQFAPQVGNLFDVKLQAIHNLHEAGVDIVPVTTISRHQQRAGRPIIQFALDNPKKINFLSFQPVSFTAATKL